MEIEKKKLNTIRSSIEQELLELEKLLDQLTLERSKLLALGQPTKYMDLLIADALNILPPEKIKQGYLVHVLNKDLSYSQIKEQVDLIFFKKILRKKFGLTISPGGNDKLLDAKFADALKVPTAKIYQKDTELNKIDFCHTPFVLKPTNGSSSKNVYYVYSLEKIVEVKSARIFESLKALKEHIVETGYKKGWQTEELLLDAQGIPSTDLKVYSYYGEIGLVLEIFRKGKAYRCWYSPEGEIVEFEKSTKSWFEGNGFDKRLLEYTREIALATPTPFLRVDFYQTENGYYLGEITPHPGRYYKGYSTEMDTKLGKLFVEAKARLFADLIKGKKFDLYFDIYKNYLR